MKRGRTPQLFDCYDDTDCPSRVRRLYPRRDERYSEDFVNTLLAVGPMEYRSFLEDIWNIRRKMEMLEYAGEVWFEEAKAAGVTDLGRWCCADCNLVFSIWVSAAIDRTKDIPMPYDNEKGIYGELTPMDKAIVEQILKYAEQKRGCDVYYPQV